MRAVEPRLLKPYLVLQEQAPSQFADYKTSMRRVESEIILLQGHGKTPYNPRLASLATNNLMFKSGLAGYGSPRKLVDNIDKKQEPIAVQTAEQQSKGSEENFILNTVPDTITNRSVNERAKCSTNVLLSTYSILPKEDEIEEHTMQ